MSMNVKGVTSQPVKTNTNLQKNNTVNNTANKQDPPAANNNSPAAVYEKSSGTVRPDTATLSEIKAAVNASTERLRELVSRLLTQQGQTWNNAFNINMINIDDATRAEAASLVAEDGFWGVEQTAQRIFDFAKAISGGDPSKLEQLRGAVEQGFKNAERIWGGELPEISRNTLSRVREMFDGWASEAGK